MKTGNCPLVSGYMGQYILLSFIVQLINKETRGGFYEGSSRDPRYNLSFIVEQSVEIGKPIIGVGFNYRLHGWGFLYSQDVLDAGIANLGLRDQRYERLR